MEQRERFVRDDRLALYTMTELCDRYDISRKTGYKWLERFDAGGRAGLSDRSRAPHQCPHRITDHVTELICLARRQHPSWGPEKLLQWLKPRHPDVDMPAVSTAGDLLARKGLVKKRRRRRPAFTASRNSTSGSCGLTIGNIHSLVLKQRARLVCN